MGSSQYLKEKFGAGYTLETKINSAQKTEFFECIQNLFIQQAKIVESFSNRYVFSIPRDSIKSLAHVFDKLEKCKLNSSNRI